MEFYCVQCKNYTKTINPRVLGTSNGKAMLLSKCAICGSKISRYIKNPDAREILSNWDLRAPLSKIPVLGDILF